MESRKRVLVTGATGFLGKHLCRALSARGDIVIGLVRSFKSCEARSDLEVVVPGDVTERMRMEQIVSEHKPDIVFHLAAQTEVGVAKRFPISTYEQNVMGTLHVLEACRLAGVERVIVASSDKAYGESEKAYDERDPLRGGGTYETSKACADLIAQAYRSAYKMPVAVTRCANLYGPEHEHLSALIPGTIASALRGERPVIRSDGTLARDYLYVADAVEGYLKLADAGGINEPMNFGTGTAMAALVVVKEILLLMGRPDILPVILGETINELPYQCVSAERARERLGWVPKHTLRFGLQKTIDWYSAHLSEVACA